MPSLRQVLKEYLELPDKTVESTIDLVVEEWTAILANSMTDGKAAEVAERLIGIPDWTKKNEEVNIV